MSSRPPRRLRLVEVPALTKAQIAALERRIAAAQARNGGPTSDPDIPDEVPSGSSVIHGPARRGRPPQTPEGSQPVTLRIPLRVLSYFKRGGPGWQTRAIDALTKAAGFDTASRHGGGKRS